MSDLKGKPKKHGKGIPGRGNHACEGLGGRSTACAEHLEVTQYSRGVEPGRGEKGKREAGPWEPGQGGRMLS